MTKKGESNKLKSEWIEKKENAKQKKAAAAKAAGKGANKKGANAGGQGLLAIADKLHQTKATGKGDKGTKSKGKGKGKGKNKLPPGAWDKTAGNKLICFAWNRCEECVELDSNDKCRFENMCWFCGDTTHRGNNCPNKP